MKQPRSVFRIRLLLALALATAPLALATHSPPRPSRSLSVDYDFTSEEQNVTDTMPNLQETAPTAVLARLLPNAGLPVQETLDIFDMFFDFHPTVSSCFVPRLVSGEPTVRLNNPLDPTFEQTIVDLAPSLFEAAVRHTTRLVSSINEAAPDDTRFLEVALRQRLPSWGVHLVSRMEPAACRLERWHEADDFVKQYEDAVPHGQFEQNFITAAQRARQYLQHLPHDVEVCTPEFVNLPIMVNMRYRYLGLVEPFVYRLKTLHRSCQIDG